MARVTTHGHGGEGRNRDNGKGLQAPRSSALLRPLSFLVGAGVLMALSVAVWGQEGMSRPRARGALQTARECYNRGDYAAAQLLLDQIQVSEGTLVPEDMGELADLKRRNQLALEERRKGTAQLMQAEDALAKGHPDEAGTLVKALNVNRYLSQPDKEHLVQLTDKLRTAPGSDPAVKEDARTLTTKARGALKIGDLDHAEQYARQAEKVSSSWPAWLQLPWSDSPARVLRDVQAARKEQADAAARPRTAEKPETPSPLMAPLRAVGSLFTRSPAPKDPDPPAPVNPPVEASKPDNRPTPAPERGPVTVAAAVTGGPSDPVTQSTQYRPTADAASGPAKAQAIELLGKGGEALRKNDLATAQKYAEQARSLHARFEWWEDNPEKLMAEISRRTSAAQAAPGREGARPPAGREPVARVQTPPETPSRPAGPEPTDPRGMVREGFARLREGKLDDADRLSLKAAAMQGTRWGLFEDNPDTLRVAVQKARAQKDREESVRVLTEARRLHDKGDYKQAKSLAYRARQLHGPYSMWDRGDRPDRLLAEIQTSEARAIREGRQPAPDRNPTVVAQQKKNGQPEPSRQQGPSLAAREAKQRALGLMAEARDLQRQGKLIEARQKALDAHPWAVEAEKGGVSFARTDDTPQRAEADLAVLCEGQIQALLRRAEDCVNASAPSDSTAYQRADACLSEARRLAATFKLDAGRIDDKTIWLREAQARSQGQTPQVAQKPLPLPGVPPLARFPGMPTVSENALTNSQAPGVAVAGGPANVAPQELRRQGLEMLEKARLELERGQLFPARRLGEQVFTGPYGLQNEARGFLNSIAAEEHNQKLLAANHKFDETHDAFKRRDYSLARTVLAGVDERLLSDDRLVRLREISAVREMQPGGGQPAPLPGRELRAVGVNETPGKVSISDLGAGPGAAPGDDIGIAERYQAMSKILFDKLRRESMEEQRTAMLSAKAGNYDAAIDTLRAYVIRLDGSNLSGEQLTLLRRQVEQRMDQYRKLKAQKVWEDQQAASLPRAEDREKRRVFDKQKMQDEVGDMMKQYAELIRAGKFEEALVVAYKMKDIDPDSPAVDAAIQMGKVRRQLGRFNSYAEERKQYFLDSMDDAEKAGKYPTMRNPIDFDRDTTERAHKRQNYGKGIESDRRGDKERHIEQKLGSRISLSFKDTPLSQIIDDLHQMTGVNVVADTTALEEAGVRMESALSLKVEDMSLKSALNILLKQARLTYVIKDEVLQITTEEHAKGKLKMITYPVCDLVVPVENHSLPVVADFNKLADRLWAGAGNSNFNYGGPMPWTPPNSLPGAAPVSSPGSGTGYARNGAPGGQGGPLGGPPKPTPGTTIEDMLIRLITQTVEPSTWTEVGGKGTIQYFPLGLALVINQTQDIQEQIQDLLAALRRLQDLEVAIEMRLVSVSEAFYEMMRLDFDLNITNRQTRYEPQLVTQQFAPPGYINAFRPNGFFSGLTPAGTFTPDLGVPINNSSFDFALPPFGGYPGTFGADGGLTLGLAFLSDIQVFMLLEAAQGDRRYNVMQAPKITVFNGQNATINVNDGQFFLTQVNVVPFGSQLVFQPVNAPILFGVFLSVTPVVSADRRFVRLNMNPTLTNLFSATTPLVPVQIPVNDLFQDNIQSVQPRIFQTFFQQPSLSQITVATTVVIPDGGTVLLGGLKALSEGRNEFGPPVLSKIPYINRLFKNVGYGRETQSLMILVTARIIINEEEVQAFESGGRIER